MEVALTKARAGVAEATAASLAAVLRDPEGQDDLKPYAISQFPRCPQYTNDSSLFWMNNFCEMVDRSMFFSMGYTIRTRRWRLTEWVRWNGSSLQPLWSESSGDE